MKAKDSSLPYARSTGWLADAVFELERQQLLRFYRKLHGQLLEHFFTESIDDGGNRILPRDASLLEIEQLLLADLGGRRFVFQLNGTVGGLDIGKSMRAALITHQHAVALRVVAGIGRTLTDLDQATIAVAGVVGGNPFGDDTRFGVFADVDHLGAGIGLHVTVGQCHRVELALGVVALQNTAGILPGDGGTGFHLRPRNLGIVASALTPLGDEIIDTALACFRVARIPVLHGAVFDFRVVEGYQFHHCGMQLVGIELRRRTAFQIRHEAVLGTYDQRAFELPGFFGIDAEISGQLHR